MIISGGVEIQQSKPTNTLYKYFVTLILQGNMGWKITEFVRHPNEVEITYGRNNYPYYFQVTKMLGCVWFLVAIRMHLNKYRKLAEQGTPNNVLAQEVQVAHVIGFIGWPFRNCFESLLEMNSLEEIRFQQLVGSNNCARARLDVMSRSEPLPCHVPHDVRTPPDHHPHTQSKLKMSEVGHTH